MVTSAKVTPNVGFVGESLPKKNTSIVISPDIRGPEMMVSSTVVLVM